MEKPLLKIKIGESPDEGASNGAPDEMIQKVVDMLKSGDFDGAIETIEQMKSPMDSENPESPEPQGMPEKPKSALRQAAENYFGKGQ